MLGSLLTDGAGDDDCGCEPDVADDRLVLDGDECPAGGRLSDAPACRATVVDALTDRDVERVVTRCRGLERVYGPAGTALLVAAGRFVAAVGFHDECLAERARRDPLAAGRLATGRAGPVARLAAETGLAACASDHGSYEAALRPAVGPELASSRVERAPPPEAKLCERRTLDTDAVVRLYASPAHDRRTYHVTPVEHRLDDDAVATLARAHRRLADGSVSGGERAPGRAVRAVAGAGAPVGTLVAVLRKHTRGLGVLADLLADPAVSDVFATAPVAENSLRLRVDDEPMRTNVRLTADGAATLASRFRRDSGRAFSRSNPTIDATVGAGGRRVRVTGVTDPVSDGTGYAFRAHDDDAWRLSDLIDAGTLTPAAAGLLSVAVERGAALLLAGERGAGKTTALGALCWELPPGVRIVLVEDTPELPVAALRAAGRDVQALRVTTGDGPSLPPAEALRTAIRLGDGALVVGEVRGEEAGVLYEAMRVGEGDGAVLGTINGGGAETVRERLVSDLGVPESAFGATDLVVTLTARETDGGLVREVATVEEVLTTDDGVAFAPLFERTDAGLSATGRVERGNSDLVATLADPDETYADVGETIAARARGLTAADPSADEQPDDRNAGEEPRTDEVGDAC